MQIANLIKKEWLQKGRSESALASALNRTLDFVQGLVIGDPLPKGLVVTLARMLEVKKGVIESARVADEALDAMLKLYGQHFPGSEEQIRQALLRSQRNNQPIDWDNVPLVAERASPALLGKSVERLRHPSLRARWVETSKKVEIALFEGRQFIDAKYIDATKNQADGVARTWAAQFGLNDENQEALAGEILTRVETASP